MALSGLDIYKLLPKTNCRKCGFATCLAFAMQLAKKAVPLDKCPYLSEDVKKLLEASAQPPIKLVTIGAGEKRVEVGNETVMFRHEEKFHHPAAIGFIIEDSLPPKEIEARVKQINRLKFERVGQKLEVNLIALRQNAGEQDFIQALKLIVANSDLGLVLMSNDLSVLKAALELLKEKRPLVFGASKENCTELAAVAKEYNVPLVVSAPDIEAVSSLTREISSAGVSEIAIDTGKKALKDKVRDFSEIRMQALKKSNRSLGYPTLAIVQNSDSYEEAVEAATYIAKYAGIVLLQGTEPWEVLSLLTLRQNIYTDPQKPLQIEPKLYPVGQANEKSPVLVTTNFSLTYYTVLGEVEASKIPSYIVSVDTEGMSVLTAWAAEKFTPDKISDSLAKFGVKEAVAHKRLIIPGYVAVMSGELEEKSGWEIIVGPKEAAGIPSFLKKL